LIANNSSGPSWEQTKAFLKQEMAKAEDRRDLGDEQRAIINRMIMEPLETGDSDSWETRMSAFLVVLMLGWLKLGFLPSLFESWMIQLGGLDLTATFFRLWPKHKANDAPSPSGVSQFWDGIVCEALYELYDAKTAFDHSLNDPSLPPWIRVNALQLKAWYHFRLQEYDSVREILRQLRDNQSVSKSKVDYLMGYVDAIENSGLGSLYAASYDEMFLMIPEAEPSKLSPVSEEAPITKELAGGVSLTEPTIRALKRAITESIGPRLLLGIWQAKEEIISSIPITRTLEEVNQKLLTEYGDWVSKLTNKGALTNAEFLFAALKAKSWSGVITEYANAVEAEIKSKLLPRLGHFLRSKGATLENILPNRTESGGSSLGYDQIVLETIAAKPILRGFLSDLPSDTVSFLLHQLPFSLAKLREARRPSAHGEAITAKEAREIRELVLGTPKKPGLLKRMTETNIP
jgi:hypothetical protein